MSWCSVTEVLKDLQMPRSAGRLRGHLDENFIVVGERAPPNLTGTEETEENFIKYGYSNEDISVPCMGPDLSLIKEMMNMLNDEIVSSKQNNPDCILEISKMNPTVPEFVPGNKTCGDHSTTCGKVKKMKDKKNRNVALTSILQNLHNTQISVANVKHENVNNTDANKIKLLKPDDFLTTVSSAPVKTDAPPVAAKIIQKVSPAAKTDNSGKRQLILQPVMFKRKIVQNIPEKKDLSDDAKSTSSSSSSPYVPSPFATQLYHEYMERSQKRKEAAKTDFVDIILNKMKEYNSQIKEPTLEEHPGLTEEEFTKLQCVLLPKHRHQQNNDCVVCLIRTIVESEAETKSSAEVNCLETKMENDSLEHLESNEN